MGSDMNLLVISRISWGRVAEIRQTWRFKHFQTQGNIFKSRIIETTLIIIIKAKEKSRAKHC